ncbi:hypothetical protein F0L68_05530 [Solihabitans fulvus]|uniref:Effector-associated domain-containing protein n=1 Tax=Solihabitans fulvus TaxID=1892852 RepID=A0A5B2XQA3_9PSEU|nr:hypothetical protein [Solihabitans fulvus]KAA2265120.1 hypothetical protein F0L68_05530 [Solihabitans fulvus]
MDPGSEAVPRTIAVVDVASYGDPTRTNLHRLAVREGLYNLMETACHESSIGWGRCRTDDMGDGLLLLLPPDIPKILLVDRLPQRLASGLRRHNGDHSDGARIRLRLALHAGEVYHDQHGLASEAVIHASRILEAPEAKQALEKSTTNLMLIASEWFYDAVVCHDPAAEPDSFRQIAVNVKETRGSAWIRLVGEHPPGLSVGEHPPQKSPAPAQPRSAGVDSRGPTLAELGKIVTILLETPGFDTREGRDLVLSQLDSEVWSAIARQRTARADVASIVRTCWRYPGALRELVEAIRFFAMGSIAMGRLDAAVAEVIENPPDE